MKYIYLLALLAIIGLSSCNSPKGGNGKITLGDTIQTPSGLQYYYEKVGKGRKVELGCELRAYLSLKVDNSVVWTSEEEPDSLYTYVLGFSRLINGFEEVSSLLREGDEIVAILPDSIAYGARGAGDVIPPHATLVYDKFKMVKVSEPKGVLADTLLKTLEIGDEKAVMDQYIQITTTADSSKYHIGKAHLYRVWDKLSKSDKHKKAAEVAACFADLMSDNKLWYRMVLSLANLGQLKEAKENLEILIAKEPNNKEMTNKMLELNKKLSLKK